MVLGKKKNNQNTADMKRLLISINVLGSAGPIRFVVKEEQLVAAVIDTALKSYAREGRLPILGTDIENFALYCQHDGSDALSPWDTIGSHETRNFMLCKKPQATNGVANVDRADKGTPMVPRKGGNWKAWFNKPLNLNFYPLISQCSIFI